MDHPNIARVLDAGATDRGRPYFVMEHVKGVPLNEYCDTQRLDMRARLELFMVICEAVQHAHQKGIIHRDYEAANARSLHGAVLVDLGRHAQAEEHLLAAAAVLETELGPEHQRTTDSWRRLMTLYEAWGKPEQAAVFRDRLGG